MHQSMLPGTPDVAVTFCEVPCQERGNMSIGYLRSSEPFRDRPKRKVQRCAQVTPYHLDGMATRCEPDIQLIKNPFPSGTPQNISRFDINHLFPHEPSLPLQLGEEHGWVMYRNA